MSILDQIMGKDPEMTTATPVDEEGFYDADLDDEDVDVADESPVSYAAPKGLIFKPVAELPKKITNLSGREGIKWEEVLAPLTDEPGEKYIIFEYTYADEAEAKRRTNLCSSKAGSIRRRLESHAPDEDWEILVRTDSANNHVAIYAEYVGEMTEERATLKAERKARYQARANKDVDATTPEGE